MKKTHIIILLILFFITSCIEKEEMGVPNVRASVSTSKYFDSLSVGYFHGVPDTIFARGTEICKVRLTNEGNGTAYDVEYEIIREQRNGTTTSDFFYAGNIKSQSTSYKTEVFEFEKPQEFSKYKVVVYWFNEE